MPLGLATVAALTPDSTQVGIWDEAVQGQISEDYVHSKDYDLIGVTGFINHAGRMNELGQMFRRCGQLTAVGGPGVSSEPELFRESVDILFIGKAEYTWPQFIADHERKKFRREYRQVGKVDMAHSPVPKWDSVPVSSYLLRAVQTTRGCPFDCEFCDVIYIYGRAARHKPVARVLQEVRILKKLGVERLLFSDDNFIGNRRYAKHLLLYALRRFPFMIERVMAAVAYQYQEAQRVPHLKRFIGEQLRQLESGEMSLKPDGRVFAVPDGFKQLYPAVFLELYARVYEGLVDKRRVENALVEVTFDFLTRWGPSFRRFEQHHRTFLYELCDRTIGSENNIYEATGDPRFKIFGVECADPGPNYTDVNLRRLADDVLRCVEQDLRSLSSAQT